MNKDIKVTERIAKELVRFGYPQRNFEGAKSTTLTMYCNGVPITTKSVFVVPTINEVLQWLKIDKSIIISFWRSGFHPYNWRYDITTFACGISVTTNAEFDTYEEAAINGIEFVLNNILK